MMQIRTCVSPEGKFVLGIHKPCYKIENLREHDYISSLGVVPDNGRIVNNINFPDQNIDVPMADVIYEIPNPFPFRGTTYINSAWADKNADDPENISLPARPEVNFFSDFKQWLEKKKAVKEITAKELFEIMPQPLLVALADTSTDPEELTVLAEMSCVFMFESDGKTPCGLYFKKNDKGSVFPDIKNHELFEVVVNNNYLPDSYKKIMVLKPGIQGTSAITGEWLKRPDRKGADRHGCRDRHSHVFEYLRTNSYIPWGHFAANTADDTVRYRIKDLSFDDMRGMRHLYYQRTFVRLAEQLGISVFRSKKNFKADQLESLRVNILESVLLGGGEKLFFNGSLWGWNFGFGYSQSGYRLHASHQQIHQQYAMIPRNCFYDSSDIILSYACGDLISDFIVHYKQTTGKKFFENYIKAIKSNTRTDSNPCGQSSLIIFEDENVILFVPKAQTSQWELQLMAVRQCGNILEADSSMRKSLDKGIFAALGLLESMNASMVTCLEFSSRFDSEDNDQRLLYSFMPKIPQSPGAFSEAQLRWINGHYPEDFAAACRAHFMKFKKDNQL